MADDKKQCTAIVAYEVAYEDTERFLDSGRRPTTA